MDGVILFADDHIFENGRIENKLFQKFNNESSYSVLPINNLTTLEKTVVSISTYKAIILDWNFKRIADKDDIDGIHLPDDDPYEFLRSQRLYSLVYVYSQDEIGQQIQDELQKLYPNKIFFNKKGDIEESDKEYAKILKSIQDFEADNKHLNVPFVWSQSINKSAQNIFSELEQADPNWLKEIYTTAQNDGAEPNTEVIEMFNYLLSESIIQDSQLLKAIDKNASAEEVNVEDKEESLAKLYNRIYYTKLQAGAPLMTGDIFQFSHDEYAILFTPECDVNAKKEKALEFLIFNRKQFSDFLENKKKYKKEDFEQIKDKEGKLRDLTKEFNNGIMNHHILPSFPFELNKHNDSALIDFESAFIVKAKVDFEEKRSDYKLNSPYIYQLRQRYLAYIGRVGVPAIPQSLRLYNLK
ncbi:MAG TPA: hypothetical protein VLZ33_05835 [Dysgonamonadaceae bacterium]|nr:hypothetical protein [Dysgonamonadaceae bacterium]